MITAAELDRTSPARCDICDTPMPRVRADGAPIPLAEWCICRECGHDNLGVDAALIRKRRGRTAKGGAA